MTKRIMAEMEGVPEDKVDVVYNGIEPLQEPPSESVERLRRELGLSGERVCLMLARLHEEKGHQVLFEALPSIVRRVGTVAVLLAGDGPHRARFEAEVRRLGLGSFVRFLGRRDDVAQLIALSSVVVVPSLAESFGFAALEAMSLGKPVVASSLGGIAEVVGECGVLTRPGSAESVVRGVCSVLEHPEQAREIGEAGRVRARLFSAGRMMRGYEAVYARVLADCKIAGGQRESTEGSPVAADR
jgi:glycosyltransferase involved in cell wall biosynthesis